MTPSQNLYTLIMAYDITNKAVFDTDEMRSLMQQINERLMPCMDIVTSVLANYPSDKVQTQNRFDALLSIADDVGIELFVDSPLPRLVERHASKTAIREAIMNIPTLDGTLRTELEMQMKRYGIIRKDSPIACRRFFEAELFNGRYYFSITRVAGHGNQRTFSVSVLHPLITFLATQRSR